MDFSQLISITDWTNALNALISESKVALQNNDTDKIIALQDDLLRFQDQTPPNFDSLDVLAMKTSFELNRASRMTAIKNIEAIATELGNLNLMISIATERANLSAEAIQLRSAKEFLGKAKASLLILKSLKDELTDTSSDVSDKVMALLKAIKDFENAFPD
jgi:hypothetical protein